MSCKRIRVTGKVQGVFYRATTKTQADNLGLKGWVINEPDGSVLIEVEGATQKISTFIDWCKQGPPFSKVDKLEQEDIVETGYKVFEIRY